MADKKTISDDATEMVFTVIARDRPGLVKQLADVVAKNGGNWIDSSMARLGGEFAGIVRISVPSTGVADLEADLAGLGQSDDPAGGIAVTLRQDGRPQIPEGAHIRLELTGLDHPGIVLEVTRALEALSVSIDELQTAVFPASMTGDAMFSAKADLVLPASLELASLREALEHIAGDIMVDIELIASE